MQRSQVYQEGAIYIRGSFPPYNIIIAQSQAICNLQLLDTHPHHDQPQIKFPRGATGPGVSRSWELELDCGAGAAKKREDRISL